MAKQYSYKFKEAAIALFLDIIQKINRKNKNKYYKFFQNELRLSPKEFETIKINILKEKNIKKEIQVIKEELEFSQYNIMSFLMILNRCIILDGCELDSYQKFEEIRDGLLRK